MYGQLVSLLAKSTRIIGRKHVSVAGLIEMVQPVRVDLFKNHVLRCSKTYPRIVDEDHRLRNALSIVRQMARRSLVLFSASHVSLWLGLRNATIQAINAKMAHISLNEWQCGTYRRSDQSDESRP